MAAGVLGVSLLVYLAAVVFNVKTKEGVLVVEVNEPGAEVFIDGDKVEVKWDRGGKRAEVRVRPGTRKVEVLKDGFKAHGEEVTLEDNGRRVVVARLKKEAPPEVKRPVADGFVSLFNGRDLTGWNVLGGDNRDGAFEVDASGGLIKARNRSPLCRLETAKDYADFHLRFEFRFEFRIETASARSGVNLRMPAGGTGALPALKVQVRDDSTPYPNSHTGGIYYTSSAWFKRERDDLLHRRGEWNLMEIIAQGRRVRVVVNGKQAIDADLSTLESKPAIPTALRAAGRIAFAADIGEVWYRKIEIKELPAGGVSGSLFNGRDLTGWSVDSGPAERWKVVDGQIVATGAGSRTRGFLLTDKEYTNFDLDLEYQVDAGTDGGVGIRALSGDKLGDLPHHPVVKLTGSDRERGPKSGALYYHLNTWEQPDRPAKQKDSEWNRLRVRVQGDVLWVWINGEEVQKLDLKAVAARPMVFPGVGRTSGRIGLQQHSGVIRFRNVRVRELPAVGWASLFNGKNLSGWKAREGELDSWTVKAGVLIGSGPFSHLYSERDDYRDARIRVEARINDGGNSGVYFRSEMARRVGGLGDYPNGWEAQIAATHRAPIKTGSLYPFSGYPDLREVRDQLVVSEATHRPDEWFALEVSCLGPKIAIYVNGKKTMEWTDPKDRFKKGRFALQHHHNGSVVEFRKVEVQELPERP